MNLSDVALAAQTAQKESLTLAEKGITSAKVVLTGFVVVFAMLILLIFIIKSTVLLFRRLKVPAATAKKARKIKMKNLLKSRLRRLLLLLPQAQQQTEFQTKL